MRSPPKYVPRDVDAAEFGVRARWPPQRGAASWCCWSAGPRSARPAALRSRPDPVNRGGRAGALRPCIRCTMVPRAQPGLEANAGVFRTVARHHRGLFGVWCDVLTGGTLSVGDEAIVGARRPSRVAHAVSDRVIRGTDLPVAGLSRDHAALRYVAPPRCGG